jgi:UDP-GlcNAc:undecaprenyl-phosphate/decaprenyl-phosphate GlcNAc-1-phosphate transferase
LPDELRLIGAFLLALLLGWGLTPVALRAAAKTDFFDHPTGYKAHPAPTAYLGGVAVISAFVLVAALFAQGVTRFGAILGCTLVLCAIGTIDDRVAVRPSYRVAAELAAAVVLWGSDLGWNFPSSDLAQLVLTSIWVVGFTNAFNLLDNMDGVASSVGAVCGAGIAMLAGVNDDPVLAALALAFSGACVGFLPFNLRRGAPARIFLGDGGSMPMGFVLAAAAMSIPQGETGGWPLLLTASLLLGIPVLDTLLVVVSRARRGVSLMKGGRDHLTHRLQTKLGSAQAVALTVGSLQVCVSLLAVWTMQAGRNATIVAAIACVALGAVVVAVLETSAWATARSESADRFASAPGAQPRRSGPAEVRRRTL